MAVKDRYSFTDPKAVAEHGEEIYRRKYREEYERVHQGKFVAIDVITEETYLGESPSEALSLAAARAPDGVFHLIKVGSSGAFRIGYSSNANVDWLFRK